jgi:hypothetical protein
MPRMIPAFERLKCAKDLIQKAHNLPVPIEGGIYNFSYIAQVKAILQDARDLIKFIPKTPSASAEMKVEVAEILLEADRANQEILHPSANGK